MPSSNQIVPCNQKHAIEETVFVLKFAVPLRPDHIQKIYSLKDKNNILKSNFPSIKPIMGHKIGLTLGPEKESKIIETEHVDLGGILFQRFKASGLPEKVLRIGHDHISYHCFEYTRWNEVWSAAKNFLKAASSFIDDVKIAIVALNVRDRFDFKGSVKDFNPANFFIKDSPYLVQNVFNIRELWHCHHGYFEKVTIPYIDRELLVTNISTETAANKELNIRINCFFEARINPPGVRTEELFHDDDLIKKIMADLHHKNKVMLTQIIKPEIAEKISLKV